MPWLSRASSEAAASIPNTSSQQQLNGHAQAPQKARNITFVPGQIDGLCGTSPSMSKMTPSQLLISDMRLMMANIRCLPMMMRSMCNSRVLKNHLGAAAGVRDTVLLFCLAVMEMCMIMLTPVMFLMMPGFAFMIHLCICGMLVMCMMYPLKSSRIIPSSRDSLVGRGSPQDERWIFVNSTSTSSRMMQMHCNRLARTFNRRIVGVHNRPCGLLFDIMEAMMMRCMGMPTACTMSLTCQLRDACISNSVRKVILIGHGTGGIHISMALDRLHADLPVDVLSKLEIYTFGSCATYLSNPALRIETMDPSSPANMNGMGGSMSNDKYTRPNGSIASPVKSALGSMGHRIEDRERVIPHTEHYAMASDMFARCGILHFVRNKLDTRFCGRLFVLDDSKMPMPRMSMMGGGFMFQEHYMDMLFPEEQMKAAMGGEMLDLIVEVDTSTAEKREFTAQGVALPLKALNLSSSPGIRTPNRSPEVSPRGKKAINPSRSSNESDSRSSSGSSMNGSTEKRRSWGTAGAMGIDCVGRARESAKECEGRSVRQLSRMWRFAKGDKPIGEGVPVSNGVGLNGSSNGMGMMH